MWRSNLRWRCRGAGGEADDDEQRDGAEGDGGPVLHDAGEPAAAGLHAPDIIEGGLDGSEQADGDEDEGDGAGAAQGDAARLGDEGGDVFHDLFLAGGGLGVAVARLGLEHGHLLDQPFDHLLHLLRPLLLQDAGADADADGQERDEGEEGGVGEGGGADRTAVADETFDDEQPEVGEAQAPMAPGVVPSADVLLGEEGHHLLLQLLEFRRSVGWHGEEL